MLRPSRKPPRLRLDFIGTAFEEKPREDARRVKIRRHERAAARPRKAEALGRQRQAGEARLPADVLGGELIERDAVAEAGADFRMRRAGEEAEDRIVAGADVGMRRGRRSP